MNNNARLGAFLALASGLALVMLTLGDGLRRAAMVVAGLVFFFGLTVLHAGMREDERQE
ncbi:hypothetical protein R8Z50_25045 [Longispora sp. K20-0274]|uniref:hypothetical protein n=1 Tax=Longispora sp. K20-0274 TaxID=3088255 RepID=UPI0039998992